MREADEIKNRQYGKVKHSTYFLDFRCAKSLLIVQRK